MTRIDVPLVLLVVGSCVAPPTTLRIRADDQAAACKLAPAFSLAPRIKEALDSWRDEPIDVWVLSTPRTPEGLVARHLEFQERIELGQDALVDPVLSMAHELTHWFALESPYANVPRFVGEGIADWVACDVTAGHSLCKGEHAGSIDITVLTGDLLANDAEWHRLLSSHRDRSIAAYRLGYEVVRQLGLPRIRAMAGANAGPLEYVEEALHVSVVGQHEITVTIGRPRPNHVQAAFIAADGTVTGVTEILIGSDGSFSGAIPPGPDVREVENVDRSKVEGE